MRSVVYETSVCVSRWKVFSYITQHKPYKQSFQRRGWYRENFQSFENRARSPHSPPRLARERLPPTPKSYHQQREPGMGWRREEPGRGRGRYRNPSPSVRSDDQRAGPGREGGRRNMQGPNRDRQREDSHQERNPPFKRQRREMDDDSQLG